MFMLCLVGVRGSHTREFSKIWKRFSNLQFGKLQNCIILAYFSTNLKNPALNLRVFGRKTQLSGKFWKILIKIQYPNWILTFFMERLFLQIEPSFFYDNSSHFERVWTPLTPEYATGTHARLEKMSSDTTDSTPTLILLGGWYKGCTYIRLHIEYLFQFLIWVSFSFRAKLVHLF